MSVPEDWRLIRTERPRLVDLLEQLDPDDWAKRSLCSEWTVEQVVAHLSAAANTGRWAWIRSITAAGFNPAQHNARLLARYLGPTPEETLETFRGSVNARISPTKDYAAFLGEAIVHGQDIARPFELTLAPENDSVLEVARYFGAKDFAVNSKSMVKVLAIQATDASYAVGEGPVVRGALIDLVMAMAGRPSSCADLDGIGVKELKRRMISLEERTAQSVPVA